MSRLCGGEWCRRDDPGAGGKKTHKYKANTQRDNVENKAQSEASLASDSKLDTDNTPPCKQPWSHYGEMYTSQSQPVVNCLMTRRQYYDFNLDFFMWP